jgi:hypothetical protein
MYYNSGSDDVKGGGSGSKRVQLDHTMAGKYDVKFWECWEREAMVIRFADAKLTSVLQ